MRYEPATKKLKPKNSINFLVVGLIIVGVIIVAFIRIPSFKDFISSKFKTEKKVDYSEPNHIKEGVEISFRIEKKEEEQKEATEELGKDEISEDFDYNDLYFVGTELNQDYIKEVKLDYNLYTNDPIIHIEFDSEGSLLLGDITGRNVGSRLGIFVDGLLVSYPIIQEAITGGEAQITGLSMDEAEELMEKIVKTD